MLKHTSVQGSYNALRGVVFLTEDVRLLVQARCQLHHFVAVPFAARVLDDVPFNWILHEPLE